MNNNAEKIIFDDKKLLSPSIPYEKGMIEHHEDGLYLVHYDKSGIMQSNLIICSKIRIIARSKDPNHQHWCLVIEWPDKTQKIHRASIPMAMIQGDSRDYRKILANGGMIISTDKKLQRALDTFLNTHPVKDIIISTNKVGWHEDNFVLPNRTFSKTNQQINYQSQKTSDLIYTQKGSSIEWRNQLCAPLGNQSRVAFAISCALAGPLLEPLQIEGGGFHLVGPSSIGKTSILSIAASVYGDPTQYIKSWNTTKNAMEDLAVLHNNVFLPLDEINEAPKKEVGDICYMLANSKGKSRSAINGLNQTTKSWNTLFLSTGEETVQSILEQEKMRPTAGMQVRLCNIDADAGANLGVFDSLVLCSTSEELSERLAELSKNLYGTAGILWLEYITSQKQTVLAKMKMLIGEFMTNYKHTIGQSHRVAKRFAIVAAAGEIATEANITGWKIGQAKKAAQKCLDSWLATYGCSNDYEEVLALKTIISFLEKHAKSRFQNVGDKRIIHNRYGYYRACDDVYLFAINSFEDIFPHYNKRLVIGALKKRNLLIFNEEERSTLKLNNKNIDFGRAYAIRGEILKYDLGI